MGFVAFTIEQAKDIWRAVRKIDGMRGDGVENTANSISIKAVPSPRPAIPSTNQLGECGPDVTLGEAGMKESRVVDSSGEPDGETWDRDTSTDSPGIYLVTGFRDDPGSPGNCAGQPPKLWGYKRLFTEDTNGGLCAIDAEVGFVIATGCCPPQTSISSPTFATEDEAATALTIRNRIAISAAAA